MAAALAPGPARTLHGLVIFLGVPPPPRQVSIFLDSWHQCALGHVVGASVLFLQTPWLLSLQGELVASLEDASLMGLYVDISATMVTIQSPRQDLLQGQQVSRKQQPLPGWAERGLCSLAPR